MAYSLVSTPSQLQGDVDPLALVGLAAICLQGDASGSCITDDCHQLVTVLELILLMDIHLHSIIQSSVPINSTCGCVHTIIGSAYCKEQVCGMHELVGRCSVRLTS